MAHARQAQPQEVVASFQAKENGGRIAPAAALFVFAIR
jgi:hypothetical protein